MAIVKNRTASSTKCKACIVKVMMKLTKDSPSYDYIDVYDDADQLMSSIKIGRRHGLQASPKA